MFLRCFNAAILTGSRKVEGHGLDISINGELIESVITYEDGSKQIKVNGEIPFTIMCDWVKPERLSNRTELPFTSANGVSKSGEIIKRILDTGDRVRTAVESLVSAPVKISSYEGSGAGFDHFNEVSTAGAQMIIPRKNRHGETIKGRKKWGSDDVKKLKGLWPDFDSIVAAFPDRTISALKAKCLNTMTTDVALPVLRQWREKGYGSR